VENQPLRFHFPVPAIPSSIRQAEIIRHAASSPWNSMVTAPSALPTSLVLVVEDERELADIFRQYLERDGFRVLIAGDGATALALCTSARPDIVVLDIRIPGPDGIAVLTELRRSGDTPVIMCSALGEDLEKLSALRMGADDYLVKPFNPLELVARVKAILRRLNGGQTSRSILRLGPIEVDLVAHEVRKRVQDQVTDRLALTQTEFKILVFLARRPGRVFERSEIVDACLSHEREALDRTVDSHVSNLRAKLKDVGEGHLIAAVRGVGYRVVAS